MQLDVASASILSAAVATVVGGGITALNLWLARRSDERRQIRELAVRAAIENWKHYADLAMKRGGQIEPLDVYLVHAAHLVSQLDGSLRTPGQIGAHLRQTFAATKAAQKEVDDYNKPPQKGAA